MSLTLTRATKVVPLCVNLSLKAEHDRAVASLADAKTRAVQDAREASMEVREAAEAVQLIEQQMRDHTVSFTLQALKRKDWAEFVAANPPRDGDEFDKALDVNVSALDKVIVQAITAVQNRDGSDVPFVPATDWEPLADEMSTAQWNDFAQAVLALNNGVTAAPFSPAASLVIQRSEQTSKRPSA